MILSLASFSVAEARTETEKVKKQAKAVKIAVDELPQLVRATLHDQVGGGKITEVKQKTKKGRVVFHADVLTGGKDWEIDVMADGAVMRNRADQCADDCASQAGKL